MRGREENRTDLCWSHPKTFCLSTVEDKIERNLYSTRMISMTEEKEIAKK